MNVFYFFLASLSIVSLTWASYLRGRKGVLEDMGAIVIVDNESNRVLFSSSEAKKSFPYYLDNLPPVLYGNLISECMSLPYRFRGKECRLFYLDCVDLMKSTQNSIDASLIHTLIQSIPEAIGLTNHEMVYQACNQAFVEPLGIGRPEDLLGKKLEEVASKEISAKFASSDKMVLDTGTAFHIVDEVMGSDGQPKWIDARKFRYTNPANNELGLFIPGRDITAIELVKKQLSEARENYKKLSMLDSLTQISNRRMFDEHLQTEWQHHVRIGKPISLILCDIDEFKKFNDVHGHIHGDKVLSVVAASLASLITKQSHSVFRYGGEEFAFILSATDEKQAQEFAESVHTAIALIFEKHGISNIGQELTVSLGVYSCYPTNHDHPIEAIQLVDEALYQAKDRGKNQTVFVDYTDS